jgi:hypothetical protein
MLDLEDVRGLTPVDQNDPDARAASVLPPAVEKTAVDNRSSQIT